MQVLEWPFAACGPLCFLASSFPETTVQESGSGEPVEIASGGGRALLARWASPKYVEQQSLDVDACGALSMAKSGLRSRCARSPRSSMQGSLAVALATLEASAGRALPVKDPTTQVARWGVGEPTPTVKFDVFADRFYGLSARAVRPVLILPTAPGA